MKRIVIAVVRLPGMHHWPKAPADVAYLASPHRHLFTFRVEAVVYHSDRDVEFHTLQKWIFAALGGLYQSAYGIFDFDARSCEHLAEELGRELQKAHQVNLSAIECWEDDENGSRVEWP